MGFFDKLFGGSGTSTPSGNANMNLQKKTADFRKDVKITLEKKNMGNPTAQVGLVVDISASMSSLYRRGAVQVASRQAAALGLEFDDDGVIPCVSFHAKAFLLDPIREGNADDFYKNLVPNGAGTNYKPALEKIISQCDVNSQDPIFIIFITDGNCFDASATTQYLQNLSRTTPAFIQFVGIGNERFSYLEKLDNLPGRAIDNAGFCAVRDGVSLSIDDLLNEFPEYVVELKKLRGNGTLSY